MMWLFSRQHTPIELPDIPRIDRREADIMFHAGYTLTDWMKLPEEEKAQIRWRRPVSQAEVVGTGADWWRRPTNRYTGCTCPPSRYDPRKPRPTNPLCQQHGGTQRLNLKNCGQRTSGCEH